MATYCDISTIPAASEIEYSNVEQVCGYQLLLCRIFRRAGGFDYPYIANATVRQVQREALIWLRDVRFLIADILDGKTKRLASIPDLISAYDIFYRISNGDPCYDYLRYVKMKTVGRWLRGDKSIADTDVVLLLLSEADRDIHSIDKRFSNYAFTMLGKWINELTKYGRFIETSLAEAYKRLTYMLRHDLFAYLGRKEKQDAAKTAWAKAYLVDDISSLDTATLRAYIPFARTVSDLNRIPSEDSEAECEALAEELASRADLHPLYREAIRLESETRKQLSAVCYPEETA